MSRRDELQFYGGLALGVGVILLLVGVVLLQGNPAPAPATTTTSAATTAQNSAASVEHFDAVIVGSGIAGLSAAYELGKGGASVLLLDMASVFGGHAVMATGDLCLVDTPFQREQGFHDSFDIAYRDFMQWGEDPDPEWVRYYVEHSRDEVYDWLISMGISFEKLVLPAGNSVQRTHRTAGRGIGLVTPIFLENARRPNVTLRWNTRVDRLLIEKGRVVGVATKGTRTEATGEVRARVVLLATGGFQSNLDRVRETWTADVPFPERFLVGSGINSMGSGLQLASAAGANLTRLDHQWNYITGLPDPRYPPEMHRGLHAVNADSVWVNSDAQRFIAERSSAKFGFPVLVRLKGATYWSIFDEATKPSFWVAGSDWGSFDAIEKQIFQNPELVKSAPTLKLLAEKSGLPPAALQATIDHWNEMVAAGNDPDFQRFGPGKDFKPHKIQKPPFYAVQFYPLTRKSMGGVAIDTQAHVVDKQGRVIPGLYAAGELTGVAGINGKAALEGTFLGPSMITGRIAGRTALAEIGAKPAPPQLPAAAPGDHDTTPIGESGVAACMTCHALPSQVQAQRPGYWHFEQVHRVVLQRGYDCMQCHAELRGEFDAAAHHFDRQNQARACPYCHSGENR